MVGSRLYVGGLPHGVRERDIERFFKGYGRVRDVLLKNNYGFVEFDDYRDADDAVYELNGKDLMGERVIVEHARGTDRSRRSRDRFGGGGGGYGGRRGRFESDRSRASDSSRYGPPTRTDYRVIVENLSSRVSWQDLKDYMRQAGEVTYADAHKNRRNEGVVEFMTSADMKTAIEKLDGAELNGRKIRIIEDKSRGRGRRSRSSSGSRSRSRSRSNRRSRSRRSSRSRSRSKSGGSRSRSKSPGSRSKAKADRKSRSKSRSKSPSKKMSRSRSKTPAKNGGGSKDRSRSKSRTPKRDDKSRSRSGSNDDKD